MKGRNIMTQAEILEEIAIERGHQDLKWGTEFDDKNTINDWATYINVYLTRATNMDLVGGGPAQYRALLKVAALAVAALETYERTGGFAPRHYEQLVSS